MSNTATVVVHECPMCGAPVERKSRDCGHCGSALVIVSNDGLSERGLDMGILDSSLEKWREKIKLNPEDPTSNYAIGMIYLNKNLRDSAIAYLRKATLYRPEFSLAHYNLSLALFDDGRAELNSPEYKESLKEMAYAETTDPDFSEAQAFKHFYLARKLHSVDAAEAVKEYNVAISLCDDIPVFYNNLGLCYFNIGEYESAQKAYYQAIELDGTRATHYSNLCLLYYKSGNYEAGIEHGEYGISLLKTSDPDYIKAFLHCNYGLCLWKKGRQQEAVSNLKKAVAYQPGNSLFTQNLNTVKNGADGSGCFIATATMGSYDHPVVMELRALRDNWILKKAWGGKFVESYYKTSPRYAAIIKRRPILKPLSFCLIVFPLYCVSKIIRSIRQE